jgi:hypothetical protein
MSSFADDLDGMIDLKVSLGYAESTFLDRSRQFDLFCAKNYPAADLITEALAMSWLRMDAGTANGVIHSRAAFLRGLARYQNAVGKAACGRIYRERYLPPREQLAGGEHSSEFSYTQFDRWDRRNRYERSDKTAPGSRDNERMHHDSAL